MELERSQESSQNQTLLSPTTKDIKGEVTQKTGDCLPRISKVSLEAQLKSLTLG